MITADQRRADAGPSPSLPASGVDARQQFASYRQRSLFGVLADALCGLLFLASGGSAALPVVWGLVLHQPPLALCGGCALLMCALALLNRLFAPAAARARTVPFLAALEERPWVLAACLALGIAALAILAAWWPRAAG
jgi:hypothetical protein